MIVRAFFHLAKQASEPMEWLTLGLNADSVEVTGVTEDGVSILARKGNLQKRFSWTSDKILTELERTATNSLSVAVAWLLLCSHDLYYDTDAFLRDYVYHVCGLRIEAVPFCLDGDFLTTCCDKSCCVGNAKNTDKLVLQVDKNKITVLIPLSSLDVQELLFGWLRRIG